MNVVPFGDQAAMAYCDDEQAAFALASEVRRGNAGWLVDVVQAYTSVAVFFDALRIGFLEVRGAIERLAGTMNEATAGGKTHVIPCCYELALDLDRVASITGLTAEAIIAAHSGQEFTVYAIGFCPGFPYLGYLPPELCGVPRLDSPRVRLEQGSVGLTGRQTGIYTEARPGGWNIVGRTPMELVNVEDGYFPLRTGDRVRFRAIGETEYRQLQGRRLG